MLAFHGLTEWIIVLVVVLVIFGGSQLPKLASNLGKAQKEFKDGLGREGEAKERRRRTPAPPTPTPPRERPTRVPTPAAETAQLEPAGRAATPATELDAGRSLDVSRRRPSSAAALEDAPALTLAAAAPHAVVDALLERVLEALARSPGSPAQILRARSTPTPSLGKNVAGG